MKIIESKLAPDLNRYEEVGMANLLSEDTHVPCYIFIRQKPDGKHKIPTIKISLIPIKQNDNSKVLTISIGNVPTIIAGTVSISSSTLLKVYKWIILNQDLLIKYWNGEVYGTKQVILGLKPI